MLANAHYHARSAAGFALRFFDALLRAVWAVVAAMCRVLGIAPPAAPRPMAPAVTPEAAAERYEHEYGERCERDYAAASDLGHAVWRFASAAEPCVRNAVDLSGLADAQYDWLMNLTNEELARLAAAGPQVCDRAVRGKRSGIVGLPMPKPAVSPQPENDARERVRALIRDTIVRNRVERCRGVRVAA